ncbi:EamA-like transporter family protein [Carnobacterium iners]|uniref:EamA-like transporter family protein n=1 Tax=Carnobacterium iners TaxID=1073423 RepID=A0A1X7MRN9_9LACT|nr:EamA family transporter [Carnobacterium iners]SEL35913.1 EamA-like transporter family protein [Carnobacterium iners]SMH27365.1 EamA-like transporter family protein [Carnobacterium iners]
MFYLTLAIICSASIALIFKYTEGTNANRYVITNANYFIAFAISLFLIFSKGLLFGITRESSFATEFSLLSSNNDYILSPYSSIIWGLIIGGIFGSFFFLSFVYYQKSIKENGVGISGTIAKLGILIPMIFSIVIWKEFPSTIQWIGIILSLVSILIVNLSQKSLEKFDVKPTIIFLFIFGGMAEFSSKFYQKYALNDYKDVFLFALFFVAFLISIFYTFRKKGEIMKKDILIGFAVGIPNLFSSYFLILALATLKTSVVFPIYSAGSIVLINIGGFLLFKEKITRKNQVAIILTIIALILINR